MASGNSGGSIQSSSSGGGDEEYDSRTVSISSFFNKNPPNFASLTSSPPPPFPPQQNLASYYNSHIIPSAQNLDLYPPSTPNFQYNNINISDGMIWPAGLRSEANSTDILRNQSLQQASSQANATRPSAQPEVTKNPKKRTRASRRAPTTVLTTDTTNFRQMVQEFTGVPTAPFPGSPYPRRTNLLSGASALRPGFHLDGLGPLYSLRPPMSQNIVSPFSYSSSSSPSIFNATMIDAIVSSTNMVTTSNKTSSAAVLGDISSNNPNNSPLLNSDQALLNLQYRHNNPSLNPSLHGQRFEASGSIDFGNYLSDFRNQEITSAAAGDLKINDGNITVWRSTGESVKNDDGIQEKFMPFHGKI